MSRRRPRTGAALVELALAVPLFLLFMIGVVDFGLLYFAGIALTNAAHAGALYGAQSNAFAADAAGIQQAARQDAQDDAITVTSARACRCPSGNTVNCVTGGCGSYGVPQVYVRVTATKTVDLLFSHPVLSSVSTVSRTVELRVQ